MFLASSIPRTFSRKSRRTHSLSSLRLVDFPFGCKPLNKELSWDSRQFHSYFFASCCQVAWCEVFLCMVTIIILGSIVLTSLFSLFYVTCERNRFLHWGWAKNLELLFPMWVNFSSGLFCLSLTESISISTEETLLYKPFTVLFNSSILESTLFSLARIRSNFFVTPSESFRTAIASYSSSEIFTSGELDSFACFSSGDASCELLNFHIWKKTP